MREILLKTRRRDPEGNPLILHTKVSDRDYTFISSLRCNPQWDEHTRSWRARVSFGGRMQELPRVLLGLDLGDLRQADHKNHDTLDNQRENIRIATLVLQKRNHRKQRSAKGVGASSKYKGVSWVDRLGRWQANIWDTGRNSYLGLFYKEEEAAKAYDAKAREFGYPESGLNFPEDFL